MSDFAAQSDRIKSTLSEPEQSVLCDHCTLPVPPGLIEPEADKQFCCNGCKSVWNVLHGAGLDGFYTVRDAVDTDAQPAASTQSNYEELDDPGFQATCVENLQGGYAQTELLLEGMHCAACVWLIERLPTVCDGVIESRANIRRRTAIVRYRPDQLKLSQVAQSLDRLGYAAHPARGVAAREARVKEDRKFLVRVGVAGAIAGNVMLMAIALHGGALDGMSETWKNTFRWYSMGLAWLALLWPGRVFLIGAIAAMRTRVAHLDIPIALALIVGGVWGSYNTIMGGGEVYFDSLAILIFFLLVGRWIQHRQQRAASDHVELMLTLTPTSALKVDEDGTTTRVPIESIEVGMRVEVEAGGSIPADGVIETGETKLDTSFLTGESRPIHAGVGDEVVAGATNLRSPIRVRVSAVGDSTRVGKLMHLVASASAHKAPIVQFADRVAARFVIVVISLAIATLAYWTWRDGLATGIEYATALLIVTCPCALGLATPMAMSIAMGRAAKNGILVKSAAAIEAMSKPGVMILDKTGTITQGSTSVVDRACDEQLLFMAAAIEHNSNHPIARAIVEAIGDEPIPSASEIDQSIGAGIFGVVDGYRVWIGSPEFISQLEALPESVGQAIESMIGQGLTPVVIRSMGMSDSVSSKTGTRFGVLGIGDPIRDDARRSVSALTDAGWTLSLCSGDHPQIVDSVADAVGIEDAQGVVSPEDKAKRVRMLRESDDRRVVMVGDGVNDAAALASADVGIAVHGGAEASLEAADVYLTKQGVEPIVKLASLGRHTMRTIYISLIFSVCYNAVAAGLAMSGIITALIAAVLMPISSLTVVAISTRAWKGD
ncbi:MAG: heavy metal translocating P-type ATPase [Phycisphaerales bacterium]